MTSDRRVGGRGGRVGRRRGASRRGPRCRPVRGVGGRRCRPWRRPRSRRPVAAVLDDASSSLPQAAATRARRPVIEKGEGKSGTRYAWSKKLQCGVKFHNVETQTFLSVIHQDVPGCKNPRRARCRHPPFERSDGPVSGTQSVERAIAVLECFASLGPLARADGDRPWCRAHPEHGPPAAACAHRRRLCRAGADDRALSAGDRPSPCSATSARTLRLQPGPPVLEQLSATTGESASLGIRRGAEVVVIERGEQRRRIAVRSSNRCRDSPCTCRRWARCCWPSPPTDRARGRPARPPLDGSPTRRSRRRAG